MHQNFKAAFSSRNKWRLLFPVKSHGGKWHTLTYLERWFVWGSESGKRARLKLGVAEERNSLVRISSYTGYDKYDM